MFFRTVELQIGTIVTILKINLFQTNQIIYFGGNEKLYLTFRKCQKVRKKMLRSFINSPFNPIPIGTGRNQPIYKYYMTKTGRNRVKGTVN